MSSPAAQSEAQPRIFVVEEARGNDRFEVFEVVAFETDLVRVRSPYLFEIGETLSIRVEQPTTVFDARVRVRAHTGPREARITELEIVERSAPRNIVTG